MANPTPRDRTNIRMMCESLRRLLAKEKPDGVMAILQDIGNIECDALMAVGDDFKTVRRSLHELLLSLRRQGIINSQNWREFFGDPR